MTSTRMGLAEVLAAAENAAPVASLDVVAGNLRDRFGAQYVSFLFLDLVGQRLLRVNDTAPQARRTGQIPLPGSGLYDEVLRTQKPVRASENGHGQRVLAPVTNRGDTIGVVELFLPQVTQDVLEQVEEAAHALAYIIVTDRRFTDLYHWGNRTTPVSLASEIQRQLLPSAPSCEAAEFALVGALVPASDIAGDTYDYSLDRDTLHLSLTDAMGHDVEASLMATLLVNASRGARRAGTGLAEQARQTHQALLDHGRPHLRHRPAHPHQPRRSRRPDRQRRPPPPPAAARRQGRRGSPDGGPAFRRCRTGPVPGPGPRPTARRPPAAVYRRHAGT